ncbi:unnamed protein product, partial [Ectocarpus sp. 8 AP-2014]
LQSWQQGQCIPTSDLFDRDLQSWQNGQQPPPQEAFRPRGDAAKAQQQQQQQQHLQGNQQQAARASAKAASDPAASPVGGPMDLKGFVGDDQLSSLEQNLTSLAYKNSMVIEKMDQKPPFSASIEQWPQAGQGQQQEQGVTGGNPGKDSASSLNGSQMSAMDVGANSSSSTGTPSDAAAAAPPAGGGPAAAGAGEGKEKTGRDGGATVNDDHPFEHFIANFLDQVCS